jgi:AcrR family transcriptional regulator
MASGIGRRRAAALADGSAGYTPRRREIKDAAARVFRAKGYRGTSLGDIAEALGTDRASLYYYVASKEALFEEVVHDAAEANVRRAEQIRELDDDAPHKLQMLMAAVMASYQEYYPYLFVYIQEELNRLGDGKSEWSREMRKINRRFDEAVVGIVQAGMDDGTLRSVSPARVVAYGIIGMLNWTHRWYREVDGQLPDAEAIGLAFADTLVNGLRTGPQ